MPPRETGKEKSQRIQMDYHRQHGGLAKSKVALAILGLVFGVAVVGYSMVDGSGANPGDVAEGHAAFEQDCGKCHQALTPIGSDSVRNLSLLGISESDSIEHVEAACTACHHGPSNPIGGHYRSELSGDWPWVDKNCVGCHADHQGRDHDLTRVADEKCAQCHDNLESVCPSGSRVVDKKITSFSSQHGDFRSLQTEDPGTVTFDHAQHLKPGQAGQDKDLIRLGDLEPEMRERYRRKMLELKQSDPQWAALDTSDDGLVQLDCASCHQINGAPSGSVALSGDDEVGRYLKPISFDDHCRACHSMNPAGRTEGSLPIPHAAPWSEMDQWLAAKMVPSQQRRTSSNPTGIGVTESLPGGDSASLAQQWKEANLDKSREMLKQQCLKCHQEGLISSDESIMAARDVDARPLIPSRWLKYGIYDHAAHRNVDCRYCHAQAYDDGTPAEPGKDQHMVMIAGIESCVGCHRPAESPTPAELLVATEPDPRLGGQSLWASDRCTMCHRYHATGSGPSENAADTGASE